MGVRTYAGRQRKGGREGCRDTDKKEGAAGARVALKMRLISAFSKPKSVIVQLFRNILDIKRHW